MTPVVTVTVSYYSSSLLPFGQGWANWGPQATAHLLPVLVNELAWGHSHYCSLLHRLSRAACTTQSGVVVTDVMRLSTPKGHSLALPRKSVAAFVLDSKRQEGRDELSYVSVLLVSSPESGP